MDTTHILFIVGGTFTGLEDIIKKRLGRQMIGFGAEDHGDDGLDQDYDVLGFVQPEDLKHYGMIPELLGRLPCITTLGALDEEAMVKILTEPRNALIKQYQRLFQMENAALQFTDDALHTIALKAMAREVGARALRSITEEIMLDLMYDLPEQSDQNATYEITSEMVSGDSECTLFAARKQSKKSA